ncbi:MAG: hypothetical protein AAFZ15_02220 [Bacteroidota bacterium]
MNRHLPTINLVAYIGLVIVNILALQLPFFGRTPGDVADLFFNPFTPADFVFKIWSAIYVLLGVFIIFQSRSIFQKEEKIMAEVQEIGYLFVITCLLNFSWLLTWQSLYIGWAFGLVFILWISLIVVGYRLTMYRKAHWSITVPFSIYLSWVSLTALANLNVLLIDLDFGFFGLSPESWAASLVVLGVFGCLLVFYLNKDYWFLLVLAWGYFGTYMKNRDADHYLPMVALGGMIIVLAMTIAAWGIKRREGKPHLNS